VADWHEDQPDNVYEETPQDCLGLFEKSRRLQWDDGTCSDAVYYVCEKF